MSIILVKCPSRGRATQFKNTIYTWIENADHIGNIYFMFTIDEDDPQLDAYNSVIANLFEYSDIIGDIYIGSSGSKVVAINRDMDKAPDHELLLLFSDDMASVQKGWDTILLREAEENEDVDVFFHNDGFCEDRLNTMPIIRKRYFDLFGYIYNPTYRTLSCDAEFMFVSKLRNKSKYFEQVLFRHDHPSNGKGVVDDIYRRNIDDGNADAINYVARRNKLFL